MLGGMKARLTLFTAAAVGASVLGLLAQRPSHVQDWTNYVRIGAYGLKNDNALQIVRSAQTSNVSGI